MMYKSQFRKMDPYGFVVGSHFMSYLSKHYFCICNCRLNAFNVSVNTSTSSDEASAFPLHCKDAFC